MKLDIAPQEEQKRWTMMIRSSGSIDEIFDLFLKFGNKFEINTLTNTLSSIKNFIKLRPEIISKSDKRLYRLFGTIAARAEEFNSVQLSVSAHACMVIEKRLKTKSVQFYQVLTQVALSKLESFKILHVSVFIIPLAWAQVQLPRILLDIFTQTTIRNIRAVNVQYIYDMFHAFVQIGVRSSKLYTELFPILQDKFASFPFEEKIDIVSDVATIQKEITDMELNFLPLFAAINSHGNIYCIPTSSHLYLTKLIWSFAYAKIQVPNKLYQSTLTTSTSKIQAFSIQHLILTAWSFATTLDSEKMTCERFFKAFVHRLNETLEYRQNLNEKDIVHALWSLALVGYPESAIFDTLSHALLPHISSSSGSNDSLNRFELSLIYLVYLHYRFTFSEKTCPLEKYADNLRIAYLKVEPFPSKLQRDLSASLEILGTPSHSFDYIDHGLLLHIAFPKKRYAIIVHGPSHFHMYYKSEPRLNATGHFKLRLLRHLGWALTNVYYYECEHKQPQDLQNFLQKKIPKATLENLS